MGRLESQVYQSEVAPEINLSSKKKIAFVCSGGAVKAAAFHVGVALALEEAGFIFDGGLDAQASDLAGVDPSRVITGYVGSSAGSLITTYLANGGSIKQILASFQENPEVDGIPGLKYWEMLAPRVRNARDILSWNNFILRMLKNRVLGSPLGTEGIVRYLREHVLRTERFSELRPDLYIVTTEVNRPSKVIFGKAKLLNRAEHYEYRNDVSIPDACAASMSLPPIYHPYRIQIDGEARDFFDGEILEPLSSHVARDLGADLVICSYTHKPLRMSRQRSKSLAELGVQHVTLQGVYQAIEQKIRSARASRNREKELLDIVQKFFKENELPKEQADRLMARLEERMIYHSNIDYIYIHPRQTDLEMFMAPHFSLKRSHTERVAQKGYVAGRLALRNVKLSP